MYGVVVMAALMAGGESPEFGNRRSVGCYGCSGYGCYSAGYGGYNSCHGYGGGHGSCWGGACYGSGHGSCWGGACYGSYSCAGGWGGACYGSYSCAGGWGGACYGSYSCSGSTPYFKMYEGPVMPPAEVKPDDLKKRSSVEKERARLVIEVPADAKLYIDDQLMKTASEKRVFNTPTLETGSTYYYILRVEVAREGTTHTETRRVLIKAGDEVTQSFTESSIASASKAGTTASR